MTTLVTKSSEITDLEFTRKTAKSVWGKANALINGETYSFYFGADTCVFGVDISNPAYQCCDGVYVDISSLEIDCDETEHDELAQAIMAELIETIADKF